MPRPWLAPKETDACAPSTAPLSGGVLVASFRAPNCGKGTPRWTFYRSVEPQFSSVDDQGHTVFSTESAWLSELDKRAGGTAPLIYIHGYFNDQSEAVRRAYAIRTLLCDEKVAPKGGTKCVAKRPVVAITWPSYKGLSKYTWDEANSEWAESHAARVILEIARRHEDSILIAHSMGNRLLVAATLAAQREGLKFKRVVLASPDVDRQSLAELLQRPFGLGYPTTIYASRKDQALSASWRTHGNPRAGDLSYWVSGRALAYPYVEFNHAEVIDTTNLHAGVTGHAAFIETPEAAADLCHVLTDEPNPARVPEWRYWTLDPKGVALDGCRNRSTEAVRIAKSSARQFDAK